MIATWYRTKRIEKEMTQTELAEAVGISVQALQAIEYGHRLPSAATWFRLYSVLVENKPYDHDKYVWNGELLYNIRRKYGLKQKELEKRIGVSSARVSSWENGTEPNLTFLNKLCREFDVKMWYFFERVSADAEKCD